MIKKNIIRLSVIIPVYNEIKTIDEVLLKVSGIKLKNVEKEIIVVDDFSTDGTRQKLSKMKNKNINFLFHKRNKGKGGAIKTALGHATGDIIIFQDADLEYDVNDYEKLVRPIIEGHSKAVYGSRFLGKKIKLIGKGKLFLPMNYLGNKFLIILTNVLYNSRLTDMDTCYTVFKSDVIKNLRLKSDGFEVTPEITAKVLKSGIKIHEVPINYAGRDYSEGKKIGWKDGIIAAYCLLKYRFVD